ncbi:hypothetical protein [Promicromonospora sp. NPDC019610]|uniref:hypothetical protein n=1 Tax=Promicromonospora sp. NPDC019610 TaxID=3364405 RepID=UPI0037A3B166
MSSSQDEGDSEVSCVIGSRGGCTARPHCPQEARFDATATLVNHILSVALQNAANITEGTDRAVFFQSRKTSVPTGCLGPRRRSLKASRPLE